MLEMQSTNFKKLFEDEIVKLKASSSSVLQNHPIIRPFREAIWVSFLSIIFFGVLRCWTIKRMGKNFKFLLLDFSDFFLVFLF
jgi:hypothetical protein